MRSALLMMLLAAISFFMPAQADNENSIYKDALPGTTKQVKDWDIPEDYTLLEEGSAAGSLTEETLQLENGKFRDGYLFEGATGQECHISLVSRDFDTFLILTLPDGNEIENDDIPWTLVNTNSRLELDLPLNGQYGITVTSYRAGETGDYSLSVSLGEAPVQPYSNAADFSGTLEDGDEVDPTGRLFDRYEIEVEEVARVTISLRGNGESQLDTFLAVVEAGTPFPPPAGAFSLTNDDFDGLNSQVSWVAVPGTYSIVATSYSSGAMGEYEIRVLIVGHAGTLAAAPDDEVTYWGIFCGINDYGGPGNLRFCREDAEKLYRAFEAHGLMDHSTARLLLDLEATPGAVASAFGELALEMDDNDVFVFFYSGHGGRTPEGDYPEELDGKNDFLYMNPGDTQYLFDDDLNQLLEILPENALKLIAIDACNSGGFSRDVISAPNRVGFFSSEEDVLSLVAVRFNAGGYLSHFLVEGVKGNADLNRNGVLTVGELKDYLLTRFAEDCNAETTTDDRVPAIQQLVYDRGSVGPARTFITLDND